MNISPKPIVCAAALFTMQLLLQGCNSYEPVAVSECGKVVAHASKVLGNFAPSHSDLMKECKKASDSERGCIMAATKKGQIAQCG